MKYDYIAEFKRRTALMLALNADPLLLKQHYEHYRWNPVDFIEDWCVTYDPRNKKPIPKVMPFLLFDRQIDFVQFLYDCWRDGESGLVEKCRDVGASWLCVAFSVWLWIFHDGSAVGWGSRKEEYVDKKGDMKAIFPKIRMIIENLPPFFLPEFNVKEDMPYMRILNNHNGSGITGEAGDNIGRGGRTSIYFKDESAHYERPELIEASLGDNTNVQIDISSVHGTNNVFYRRRMAGELWEPGKDMPKGKTRVFIFDWRHHPDKTQEWYDRRRAKAEDEGLLREFAQEVDRDYAAAVDRVIIPAQWVKSAIDAHKKLKFEASGMIIAMQDVADEGGDKNAIAIRRGPMLLLCEAWGEGDTGQTARRSIQNCKLHAVNELYYDCIGVGAGFKSDTNRMREEGQIPDSLRINKWNAAASPLYPTDRLIEGDMHSPTNEDFFQNLKAQGWWMLRRRFEKTHKAVTQGVEYPPEELIAIPSEIGNLHLIEAELSQATQKTSIQTGKMVVDKKPEGGRSPNMADAIVGAYWPARELTIFDVL